MLTSLKRSNFQDQTDSPRRGNKRKPMARDPNDESLANGDSGLSGLGQSERGTLDDLRKLLSLALVSSVNRILSAGLESILYLTVPGRSGSILTVTPKAAIMGRPFFKRWLAPKVFLDTLSACEAFARNVSGDILCLGSKNAQHRRGLLWVQEQNRPESATLGLFRR